MPDAIVIGGGVAGLSAALGLSHSGYWVKLLEEAPTFAPAGAALSIWGNGVSALKALGVDEPIRQSCAIISGITASAKSGKFIMKTVVDDRSVPEARVVPRTLLHDVLLDAVRARAEVCLGRQAVAVDQSDSAVRVQLADGEAMTADLIVVADGISSDIASRLIGNPPRSAGYGGIIALSDQIYEPAQATAGSEYWAVGERIGLFGLRDGRCYWYHMLSGERAEAPADQHARLIAQIDDWPKEVRLPLISTPTERLIPVRIWSRPPPSRLGQGRVLVVGDAAHAMEPNLGQGACQALEDAVALMAIAGRTPPHFILPLLEKLRLSRIKSIVRAAGFRSRLVAQPPNRVAAAIGRLALALTPASAVKQAFRTFHRLPDYDALAEAAALRL